jgi:hypothetical protein
MGLHALLVASALSAAGAAPALAQDQGPPVSAVIAFSGGLNQTADQQLMDSVKAINTYANGLKGNPCKGRFLQATFAGQESGAYIAVIECPSMEALAKSGQILNADAQFRRMNADVGAKIQAAGGKLLSQSLYQDVR